MRAHTAAAVLLAAGLALAGCTSSSGDGKATASPSRTATAAPAYDPAAWKTRVRTLVSDLDTTLDECNASPSSDTCADSLRAADSTLLTMKQAIDNSGHAAQYPATTARLRKIIGGYNDYISGNCPGDPAADAQGSDCRSAMAMVLLGTSTLTSQMILDGGT